MNAAAYKFTKSLQSKLKLLTVSNPKTEKGMDKGYITGILHFAPHTVSGYNVCASSTPECRATCIFSAGRGAMQRVQDARIRRTKLWFQERDLFLSQLKKDIDTIFYAGIKANLNTTIRLNGTSDIRWENYNIIQLFPDISFYDYTKHTNRKAIPPNYHLTFSFSGHNLTDCKNALANGMSVAVPFLKPPPATWLGYPVISGENNDLRFEQTQPVILALKAKGLLRRDPHSHFLGDNHNV